MKISDKGLRLSAIAGLIFLAIGLLAFVYNWKVVGGGWPYFSTFLFPGNLVLALFSEEIDFWPKFALQMSGQFLLPFLAMMGIISFKDWLK
ncbi:hypothetical protein BTJ40_10595 [Microbulbifer sp. A4B17]|uniref:hypothetical protein n=1 Tax=Microbulbifer sp. A4B17 TaxID=359370 RepID=UPI000D52D39B|nr:hypothetical protein [Microbulbifer sp. A4B17]AWF81231.1 hypothetical protein BTJ40_10595 [Microbulbifer sp. A4B17]